MVAANVSQQRRAGVTLNYISLILSSAVGLILVPFMLRRLGQSEYGLYQLIGAFVGYLTVLDFGMASTVTRYVAVYRAKGDRQGEENFLATAYLIYGFLAALIVAVGIGLYLSLPHLYGQTLTPEQLSEAQAMFAIVIVNLVLSLMGYPMLGTLKAYEQFIFPGYMNIIKVFLEAVTLFVVLALGGRAIAVIVVESIFNVAYFGACAAYALGRCHVRIKLHHFEVTAVRIIFFFSFFVFLETVVNQIFWKMDQGIIGIYFDTSRVAIYAVGTQISAYYLSLGASISPIVLPLVTHMEVKQSTGQEFTDVLIRTGRIQFVILGILLSGFILFGQMFIRLWAGPAYADAYAIALVVMIPVTIPLAQNTMLGILKAKNQHQFYAILYLIIAVINIPLTILFVNLFGYAFAAVSTAIMLLVGNTAIMNWYYHRRVGIDVPRFFREMFRGILPGIILATIIGLLIRELPGQNWFGLVAKIGIYAVNYGIILWFIGFNGREKSLAKRPIMFLYRKLSPRN